MLHNHGVLQNRWINSVIQGDARAVLPSLADSDLTRAVKLAYLDPPYNTRRSRRFGGNYTDHRTWQDWSALLRDVLVGVHDLLRDDGSLWLHMDASGLGPAQETAARVFGEGNFAGLITWEKTRRPSFAHGQLASVTDHILVYGKNRKKLDPFAWGQTEIGKRTPLVHRGNRVQDVLFPPQTVRFNGADGLYPAGDHSSPGIAAALLEYVVMGSGRNLTPLRMRFPSRYSSGKVDELIAGGGDFLIPKAPFRPSFISPEAHRSSSTTCGRGSSILRWKRMKTARNNRRGCSLAGPFPMQSRKDYCAASLR